MMYPNQSKENRSQLGDTLLIVGMILLWGLPSIILFLLPGRDHLYAIYKIVGEGYQNDQKLEKVKVDLKKH